MRRLLLTIPTLLVLFTSCNRNAGSAPYPENAIIPHGSPSVILSPIEDTSGEASQIYEDADYKFIGRHYGNRGRQVPGFFVFSKHAKRWMEIQKVSTEGAKLGRSPNSMRQKSSVSWNFTGLRSTPYASMPLHTSGSIMFPRDIVLDIEKQMYAFRFNSDWKIDYVLTIFYVQKADLDNAFK